MENQRRPRFLLKTLWGHPHITYHIGWGGQPNMTKHEGGGIEGKFRGETFSESFIETFSGSFMKLPGEVSRSI